MQSCQLFMGRSFVKFIQISPNDVTQLDLHPFLTPEQSKMSPQRNWFGEIHLQEVISLIQPVLHSMDKMDNYQLGNKSMKNKQMPVFLQDCLVGSCVRLGFVFKRNYNPGIILVRSALRPGCRGSLSVLNMKLVVYVCQRQYAGDINMMSAFTQHVRKAETDGQMQISAYFTGKLADGRDCSSDVEATRAAPPSPTPNTALSTTYITTLPLQSNHTGTSFCKLSISSDLGPSPVAMCLEDDSNVNAV